MNDQILREHLLKLLDGKQAHVGFEKVVPEILPEYRGAKAKGVPYTAWELLEHLRLAQIDIIGFCRNPDYKEPKWPDDYWPSQSAPANEAEWEKSVEKFKTDLNGFKKYISKPDLDLFATIPHGSGQTYLREALLIADHNSYHLGQIVLIRRVLGIW